MPDWERLGDYVLRRRVALKYQTRDDFAKASGISTRTLAEIEKGEREGRFAPKTIAALEHTLGWAPGSATTITNGGEPTLLPTRQEPPAGVPTINPEALARVMSSGLSDEAKHQILEMLAAEQRAAERRQIDHAADLVRLMGQHGKSA